jgi:peptidoglycan/LPS O-acetylase OafA/YrhL
MIKLKYRPEIAALRAIAVIAVIVYHAKIYFLEKLVFPGSFLGVDVLFLLMKKIK